MQLVPSYWASVSGGKDSFLMLKLLLSNLDRYKLDGVVHFELEIDYPFIKDVVDYMESECKKYGIKFVRIKPRVSWYDLYDRYGFPCRSYRWCNSHYKLDCAKQLAEYMKSLGCYVVSYIGYCADEEKRFANRVGCNEIYPLVDFNIAESYVLEWARDVPLYNNFYKINKRCGCMFCPMASRIEMAYLLKYYPLHYAHFIDMARKTEIDVEAKTGKPFSVWNGNPKYNTLYIDNIVRNKWLGKLEEIERGCFL